MTDYKVVAECAHVVVDGGIRLIYKGAPVPDGQTPERLKHLLDSKLIAPTGEVPVAPNSAVVPEGFATTGGERVRPEQPATQASPSDASEVDQRRAAAKAQLPEDGSAPDGRKSDAVFVEYLVAKGYAFEEASKASSAELRKLAKDAAAK